MINTIKAMGCELVSLEIPLKSRSKTLNFEPFFNENALISLKNGAKSLKKRPFFSAFGAKFNVFTQKFNDLEAEILNFEAKFSERRSQKDGRVGFIEGLLSQCVIGYDPLIKAMDAIRNLRKEIADGA